jgi:hypothetical protein
MRFGLGLAAIAVSALFTMGGITPATAQDEPRLDDLEEQVLRSQVEVYLNEFAKWDETKKRVVIVRREREGRGGEGGEGGGRGAGRSELGGLEPIGEMMLQRMTEKGSDGRLVLRDNVKLRPFAKVAQDYIAEGGLQDVEAFQRFRSGQGENPFKDGMPPRVSKAVAGLLKALNEQTMGPAKPRQDGDGERDGERRREVVIERERKDTGERREEARKGEDQPRRGIRVRIAERLDLEPEEMEQLERYAQEMLSQFEKDVERMRDEMRARIEEFSKTDRGRDVRERFGRLRRRAEDELRRALDSDQMKERLEDVQRRAMEFLASPEGQEMQRRFLEFLDSDDGREVRRRLDEFLSSEDGRELLRRLADRFAGRTPEKKAERAKVESEDRKDAERRQERRPREPRRQDEPRSDRQAF